MLHTPKITPGGSTAISPVISFAGVSGATFDETLTNYVSSIHDLYTFTTGYDGTLEKSKSGATGARVPRGNYYTPTSWNPDNFIIKEAGKTAFTPFSVVTGWYLQYGPEYKYNSQFYSADAGDVFKYEVRNIGPLNFSNGLPGIGPRWVLVAPDVVMSMYHFVGSPNNRSPLTEIYFIGSDGVKRGYTLEAAPYGNGSTANCIMCDSQYYKNYDSSFPFELTDFIFCKLKTQVDNSIKPVIFLNNYTNKEKFITDSILNNIPYLTINRCRTIGYLYGRYIGLYSGLDYISGRAIYNATIGENYCEIDSSLASDNSAGLQYLNNTFLIENSKIDLINELYFDTFEYLKYSKIPNFYVKNMTYKNTLTDKPIHVGDSSTPQFIIVQKGQEYRPVLISLYGSGGGSEINLWNEMGNVIDDGVLPVLNSAYSKVERLGESFITNNALFNDPLIKKPFGADSAVLFFTAPKTVDDETISICAIDDLLNPNLGKIKGLPPAYYSETDVLYKGITNTAVAPYYSSIVGMTAYGTIPGVHTFDSYTLELFDEIKDKLELNFNISKQSSLFLQTNKKYIFTFNGNEYIYNRPDLNQAGITHIKYDNYADWISLASLGTVPFGLSHAIKYDGIKNSMKAPPVDYYLSTSSSSIDNNYLVDDKLKKIKKPTEFPYFFGVFNNLDNINAYFDASFSNTDSQFDSITAAGYPLLRYNQLSGENILKYPYSTSFTNEYGQSVESEETFSRNFYIFDSTGFTGTIYLHAVSNNEILTTMPIHFERYINDDKLLLSSKINVLGSTGYYELGLFKESHMKYLGGTYPSGLTVTGLTFIWNKKINDYITPDAIQIYGNNYSVYSDDQSITPQSVSTPGITGTTIISFGITA